MIRSDDLVQLPGLAPVVRDIAAAAAGHDRDASLPVEAFRALHELGALDLTIPLDAGGRGGGLRDAVALVETVGAADASAALILSQHLLFQAVAARSDWPARVRRAVQQSSLQDGALINALRVEPELGTPARGGLPETVARRRPNESGWFLSGHKIYATGIPALAWMAVYARTDEAPPRVGTFLVHRKATGWRMEATWDHLGMRATASHDVIFDETPVPDDFAVELCDVTEQRPDPFAGVWNSLLIAAVYNGVANAAAGWLGRYLHERVPTNLGASLATLERFQQHVGHIEALLRTNGRLLHSAASSMSDAVTIDDVLEASVVKHTVTTNAIDAVQTAVALIGNPALSRSNPLERHLRDVLCSRIHTPQDDAVLLAAGRHSLKQALS